MSVTRARTHLAGERFTLNSSRRAARCLHSSSQRQAEANESLNKAKSTDMRDHFDNIEQMHVNYKLHGDIDFSGADVGELDVHLHPRWGQLPPTGIRGAWNWLRDRYHNGYKNYYACVCPSVIQHPVSDFRALNLQDVPAGETERYTGRHCLQEVPLDSRSILHFWIDTASANAQPMPDTV